MRFFLTLAYNGTRFSGWQIQPNAASVQGTLETALSTILREKIEITGCGRTDTGVHASAYIAHFDTVNALPPTFLNGLNSLLPADIAVFSCRPVADDMHARFSAVSRSYAYYLSVRKDPFRTETAWFYPQAHKLDRGKMQEVALLLKHYTEFYPFCKTHSGVDHYRCQITDAHWEFDDNNHQMIFHVSANRFLRGMVRLIVGACVMAGTGQLTIDEIRIALEKQTRLPKNLSVPPNGLFLTTIEYPDTL